MDIRCFIVLAVSIVLMSSCESKDGNNGDTECLPYSYPFGGGVRYESSGSSDSCSSEVCKGSRPVKSVACADAYSDGYESGYMDGEDDYLDHTGYEGLYDDDSNYDGQERRDYERGYEEGYEEGYDDAKGEDGSDDGE